MISLDKIVLTSWDITCLAHSVNKNQTNLCILPNVQVIECTNACATALKKQMRAKGPIYLWNDALNIRTPSKSDIIRQEMNKILEDEYIKSGFKNIERYEQEIMQKMSRLSDEELSCSGVVRLRTLDFLRDRSDFVD